MEERQGVPMNIGDASSSAGVPAKTIRYYEEIGLTAPPARSANGYRAYTDQDIHILRFVARARGLGFSVEECRKLLTLYRDKSRASADVKRVAREHIAEVERKIRELDSMRATLATLVRECHGDDRPDCPILEELSGADRHAKPAEDVSA